MTRLLPLLGTCAIGSLFLGASTWAISTIAQLHDQQRQAHCRSAALSELSINPSRCFELYGIQR